MAVGTKDGPYEEHDLDVHDYFEARSANGSVIEALRLARQDDPQGLWALDACIKHAGSTRQNELVALKQTVRASDIEALQKLLKRSMLALNQCKRSVSQASDARTRRMYARLNRSTAPEQPSDSQLKQQRDEANKDEDGMYEKIDHAIDALHLLQEIYAEVVGTDTQPIDIVSDVPAAS